MFSGIVEEKTVVSSIIRSASGAKLYIKTEKASQGAKIGDSVAVNGVCLTIASLRGSILQFDIMDETLRSTTFSDIRSGEEVNIERSLLVGDRISGHFVTGHIDCVGVLNSIKKCPNDYKVEIKIPHDKAGYLAPKGSVSVDGVSLTIMENGRDYFKVSLIPLTLKETSLGLKRQRDRVNIEFDILRKYALAAFQQETGRIDSKFLKTHGFL